MPSAPDRRRRYEALVAEVADPLQRYLRRRASADDADDIFGDTLLVLWRRLDDVPDDPVPWCVGVARRALSNHRRSGRRRLALVERIRAVDPPTVTIDPTAADEHPEVVTALDGLGDTDREVLVLWAWEGFEARDIATVLGISDNAAANRLSRARRRLGEALSRQDHDGAGHTRGMGTHEEHRP